MVSAWLFLTLAVIPWSQAAEFQCLNNSNYYSTIPGEINVVLEKHEAALILLLGFGGLSVILAMAYSLTRRYVFDDVNNVDSTFDAGGNVSASLTAVTLAAQLLWPADLMQSVTVVVKYGIAGVFWYCSAVLVNLSLFPIFSFTFKTKAPGAKTYLQIILARCGRVAHSIYCVFALLVNVIILACIIVGGIAVFQTTVKDASPEFCVLLLATLCGSYTFIGGLGSTFYVSYFNALTTFIVIIVLAVNIFYLDDQPFGTLDDIYTRVNCLPGVQGNRDGSYFTFISEGALLWGVQGIWWPSARSFCQVERPTLRASIAGVFLVSSITYCDQSSWQSRIAAKPLQGAIGFLLASLIWFAIPATIGTVAGVTYLAKTAVDPSIHLTQEQINSGIVSAYMAQQALGKQGGIMMLTMLTMLTMSTGSGEIMGVASVIIYDIYQTYIRPFRFKLSPGSCVFCGLPDPKYERHSSSACHTTFTSWSHVELCKCPPPLICDHCKHDLERLKKKPEAPGQVVRYKCPYHGDYRTYQDDLMNFKNWCILWITLGFVPFGLAVNASGVDLNWMMMTGIIITVPCFPGVILTILWSKVTSRGLIAGCCAGLICGISADLLVAFVYYQGNGGFIIATSEIYAVVAGSISAMASSFFMTVSVCLCTHNIRSVDDELVEWQKMRDIDNPLHPWSLQFVNEFPEVKDGVTRPTPAQLHKVSKRGRVAAIIGSIFIIVVFIVIIPGTMASLGVLTASEFKTWTMVINIWCIVMAVVVAIVTPVEELKEIIMQLRVKKQVRAQVDVGVDDGGKHAGAEDRGIIDQSSGHANGVAQRKRTRDCCSDKSDEVIVRVTGRVVDGSVSQERLVTRV